MGNGNHKQSQGNMSLRAEGKRRRGGEWVLASMHLCCHLCNLLGTGASVATDFRDHSR